jgi:hypothetical protein
MKKQVDASSYTTSRGTTAKCDTVEQMQLVNTLCALKSYQPESTR